MSSRFDYIKYDPEHQKCQNAFKIKCVELEELVNLYLHDSRAQSLAMTKLEEFYMWIGKAIRDNQISDNSDTHLNESRDPNEK